MSGVSIGGAAVTVGSAEAVMASPVPDPPAGWWRAWRDRFGLAEVCGTLAAAAGFAAGYAQAGSLLAAAALATICEAIGFYGCIAVKTGAAARRATVHLGGWRRLAAGAWHAVREQLASCAVAETVDGFLIRPGCMVGAASLLRALPPGPVGIIGRSRPDGHHGWLLLVKWVSVSMSPALNTCRGGVAKVAYG